MGANGAGKTTLLLHLNGTLRPRAGAVLLRGVPVAYDRQGLTACARPSASSSRTPTTSSSPAACTRTCRSGRSTSASRRPRRASRVEEALEALEIAHLRDRPTHMLSYGQKKRAAIAGAVAMRPEALILDEPLAGLDPSGSWHLMGLLTRLHEAGTTLVVATHDMSLAYEWADEVAVLREGAIVAHGDPQDVMHDPAELAHSGLRVPWVADIAQTLRAVRRAAARGTPRRAPATISSELLESRCGVTMSRARPARHIRRSACLGRGLLMGPSLAGSPDGRHDRGMEHLAYLFANNRDWADAQAAADPAFFDRLCHLQRPDLLWIGCSDSRVPANEIVGLAPGELFVHRNVANVVPVTDLNAMAVIEYAVASLGVKHIIVCGHYHCGGIRAALEGHQAGAVALWLQPVRLVAQRHRAELDALPTLDERWDRLCELNVEAQVHAVASSEVVEAAWERGASLAVHGWIYDLKDGLIRDLGVTVGTIAAGDASG